MLDRSRSPSSAPRLFCASPWVEAVLHSDGRVSPCCNSAADLGNWKRDGLKAVWLGKAYRAFREQIREGRFPDATCEACYRRGSTHGFSAVIHDRYFAYKHEL